MQNEVFLEKVRKNKKFNKFHMIVPNDRYLIDGEEIEYDYGVRDKETGFIQGMVNITEDGLSIIMYGPDGILHLFEFTTTTTDGMYKEFINAVNWIYPKPLFCF